MTINHNELLSVLVDGELQGEELDDVLQLLATDARATAQFQHYQQTKDILQGHSKQGLAYNIIEKISVALESEPAYSQAAQQPKAPVITLPMPFWKQVTGLAVAASIGALAVVGVMAPPQGTLLTTFPIAAVDTPNAVVTVAQTTDARWTVDEPEIENRLNSYLLDHNEQTGSSGVFSYARVVSYGAE